MVVLFRFAAPLKTAAALQETPAALNNELTGFPAAQPVLGNNVTGRPAAESGAASRYSG
jgi:hypothetical protein